MKKTTLLMLTLFLSVFAFAQEIEQVPLPGLKKQPSLKQQVLMAKREGKQLNKETIAQFKVKKPATSELAKVKKQHSLNIPVQKMGTVPSKSAAKAQESTKKLKSPTMAPRETDPYGHFASLTAPSHHRFNRAAVVDEHGIITEPAEGTIKVYTLAGNGFKYSNGSSSMVSQSGTTRIVECEDGSVYINNVISTYATGAWVKGTKSGNTISVPAGQPLIYNSTWNATISARWGVNSSGQVSPASPAAEDFTFIVDEAAQTISLQGTSSELMMAAIWDDDNYWTGNAVWETVYTYDHDYVEPTKVTVEPPVGLETTTWYTKGHTYSNGSLSGFRGQVTLGIDGNDVYVQGMFEDFPEAWLKGTINGSTVTFTDFQYQGKAYGYDCYGIGTDGSALTDFVMSYDAEVGVFTSVNSLLANAAFDEIFYLTWINDIEISQTAPAQPLTPPAELNTQDWTFAGYFYDGQYESVSPVEKTLKVGAIDKDVYVQGISYYIPEAWIKGTLSEDGKSITFASGQYYGVYDGEYDMWFAAADPNTGAYLESVTVAYDAENGIITWPEDVYLLENGDEASVSPYGFYFEIDAIVSGTAPAVNELPVGLQTNEWSLKSQSYVEDEDTGEAGYEEYNYHVQVGFAENDVYILGLVESLSDAVVKGTLDTETNKITFPAGQCIGVDYDIDFDGDNWVLIEIPVYFTGFGENGMEDVVMTYDPATKTMTMDNNFMLVNNNWLLLNPAVIQRDVTITAIPDVAAVPAQPEIVWANFDTSWYPYVEMEVPQIAADGSEILSDKLFYQYWIEVDGVQTPLTLDPAEYTELTEPMTEIPVNFSDGWDIYPDRLYLNQDFSQWKKIGIQSIYYGGGEKKTSEIAWRTIVNFSVDEAFDNTKGEFDVQPKALEGEQVFLNINPNNGYKIAKATARVGKTPIKVDAETDEYGTTYSVIAPPADVIVNAEFEVTAADFDVEIAAGTAEAPANINEALDTQLAGMIVRNLNITLQAGEYTMTKPIIAAANLNINGNGAVIDASGIVGGEDGSQSAPFIQMSTEPQVEFNAKPDGSLTDYYGVAQIALRDLTVKGLKNSIFWDANTKYCVGELLVDNCYFQLATEAVQNEALFAFEAGGAKDLNFRNNTFVGNNAVARFFVRYNNSARLDRYGYDVATDYMVMGYVNNTFVNLLQPKNEKGDESQWANGNGVQGYARAAYNVVKNIWWNCGKDIARRLGFGRFNGNNPVTFESNTYFNNGEDMSASEAGYDQSGTILTSDPKFEDAANNDFSVRTKSDQALNQAGDWNRWGEWIVDVYDITIDIANEANGTVKAPKNAVEGEIITLEAVPTEGYRLVEGSLKVMLGKSEIVLTDNTFSMPAANVTVKAEFELIPVFAITIAEGIENGTVVADKTEAAEGDVVTLTITPNEGYELDYVVVTGVNSNISVPVEDGKFTMPADAVTVNAAFKATATGIIAVKADDLENAVIYNLQGVRVDKARKGGVYIVNGKKVAIK